MASLRGSAPQPNPRVALHLGISLSEAWPEVILPWFERVARSRSRSSTIFPAVITPSPSYAQFLRRRLISRGVSLLHVRFFTPTQVRDALREHHDSRRVSLPQHLRLLLSIAAEECAIDFASDGDNAAVAIASAIAREPQQLLLAIEHLHVAATNSAEVLAGPLAKIAMRFDALVKSCGWLLPNEEDLLLLKQAAHRERFSDLFVAGFDGAHWPFWNVLRAAVAAAGNATVVLHQPRFEAADLDSTWISSWEEHFGSTGQVAAEPGEQLPLRFDAVAAARPAAKEQPPAAPPSRVHFLIGRQTSEQARAVVALAIAFLSEPECNQVAIVLPGPGGLARLVASWLERLSIFHNDTIAHQMRGAFDDEEWRAWLELQQRPQLGPLLNFLDHSEVTLASFAPLSRGKVRDTLERACGDILINSVDVLHEYCRRRSEFGTFAAIANGLRTVRFLQANATLDDFLTDTGAIFRGLKWEQRYAELQRLTRGWSGNLDSALTREQFLRWLTEIFADSARARDVYGSHPYARVQLLSYDDAASESWSHVILAGLNEGVWPRAESNAPFVSNDEIARLNRRNQRQSRFGEGQQCVRDSASLCLSSTDGRAIGLRRILELVESATCAIGVAADRYGHSPREQAVNPSEFFARLFYEAYGRALSQHEIENIHEQTQQWLAGHTMFDWPTAEATEIEQTITAYRARRADNTFGPFEFAFQAESPPPRQPSMSASDLGNALKRPALVWMKVFLGVAANDWTGGSWNLATGQWVHRWLATIGAEPGENKFVNRPPFDETVTRVLTAADLFQSEIVSILDSNGRSLPDWWRSGWRNARHVAAGLARQIGGLSGWPALATEWKLNQSQPILLGDEHELRVRGRIDVILARPNRREGLWIVDYKTGEAKPLHAKAAELRAQLAGGDGIQICIYALALRQSADLIWASVLPSDVNLEPNVDLNSIMQQQPIWEELTRMQKTGIFGMLGELRSEFSFTGTYPLATLAVDRHLLAQKWSRTHPAFGRSDEQ